MQPGLNPAILEIAILKKYQNMVWSQILQYMLGTSFSSSIRKKPGEIPIV